MSHLLHKRAPAPQIPPSLPPPPKPKPKPKPKPTVKPKPTTTSSVVVSLPITTITTATPITTPSSTTSTLPLVTQPSTSGSEGKSNTGLIAGAVTGALAVILIAAGLVILRKRKRANQELKEAELYQQQRVMRQNDDYGFGRHRGGEDVERGNSEYLLKQTAKVQRQPSWWSRKKPLEYYQQVPPRDHLQRTKQQPRQEQELGQLGSEEATINRSAYSSEHGHGHRVHGSILEESLEPLQPSQQAQSQQSSRQNTNGLRLNENASTKPARARHEYSPSRPISSIEPISPIGSVFEESTTSTSLPYSPQRDAVHSLPSTSNNRPRARSSIPYPPPPPILLSLTSSVTPAPPSRQDGKGTAYRPPTGFYDFGGSDEDTNKPNGQFGSGYQPHQELQQTQQQQQPPPSGGVLPPPIPRATRPTSISTIKPKPRSNTNPDPGVPMPLSPTSPISPTSSEPGSGPKIGGRRARVKSRNKGISP